MVPLGQTSYSPLQHTGTHWHYNATLQHTTTHVTATHYNTLTYLRERHVSLVKRVWSVYKPPKRYLLAFEMFLVSNQPPSSHCHSSIEVSPYSINISQISGWISVGRENNCLESHVLCPQRLGLKVNKGEKYNHLRPMNYHEFKKIIIKFTYWHPSARIEIASVQIVSRIENAALKERRVNRDREIFNMTRE